MVGTLGDPEVNAVAVCGLVELLAVGVVDELVCGAMDEQNAPILGHITNDIDRIHVVNARPRP